MLEVGEDEDAPRLLDDKQAIGFSGGSDHRQGLLKRKFERHFGDVG